MQRYYISVILQSRDSKNFIFSLILIFLAELVEPAAGVVGVGIEFQRFLVVADGGVGHVLLLALPAQQRVLGSQFLEQFVLLLQVVFEPCVLGFQPVDEPIIPGGPAAFFSTLPVKKMVRHAQELGLPAAVSNTAGTFVCNDLMYSLLFYLEGEHPEIRAGFIHLPACHVLKNNPELPTMPIEIITAALEAMLAELLSED